MVSCVCQECQAHVELVAVQPEFGETFCVTLPCGPRCLQCFSVRQALVWWVQPPDAQSPESTKWEAYETVLKQHTGDPFQESKARLNSMKESKDDKMRFEDCLDASVGKCQRENATVYEKCICWEEGDLLQASG